MKGKKKDISERKEDNDSTMNANPEKELIKEELIKKHTSPPFPQALHGKKGIRNASEILEVLRQVEGLNVNKKAYLTEQVSAIIQCKSPLKYKDTGLEQANYVPIILGRPFLATSNAIINCRNGLMQLTFGNMTLELNIFYMSKKLITSEEEEGPERRLSEPADVLATLQGWRRKEEILPLFNKEEAQDDDKEEIPKLNLKPLPMELKYTYLEENNQCLIVISSSLTTHQEISLLEVLKRYIIYPISESPWVSPTQVVPKKSGITVVQMKKEKKLLHASLQVGWYFQIEIDVEDQEKTTFTCPFGTYAYRRMPFGLCNAPTTFQRCMLSIFNDMVEQIMEVFMDDINHIWRYIWRMLSQFGSGS
ncbi:Retrovirus-related Pol polyprotein from transposon 17.6 [Vitis vinifera]|uniref:Retrovirus-related Pol polyprotein from transposon 17.6 n=1 Tax=Vitis vinifera TaxID=29760 RepID=A0A438FVH7_VITVI|nr:Retrovirus-related Pol polyprotein from transposon 17.6 [Vitis vinifera]